MKNNYTLAQQFIARILLISLFLQSCGGGSNNNLLIPMGEEQTAPIQTDVQAIITQTNTLSLIGQELTAQGGHAVTFYKETGQLKADVEMNAPRGFSKSYEGVKVYIEQGTELASLHLLDIKAQERRIQLQLIKGNQPAKIVVYKGAGLVGGMLEGEEEAEEELENESIPEECFCPITQEIMEDPVIAQDGHTYERQAIKRWLDMGK
ncbi:MAG: U-box domain-containing protein [Candidatus Amoebophilus sp.]